MRHHNQQPDRYRGQETETARAPVLGRHTRYEQGGRKEKGVEATECGPRAAPIDNAVNPLREPADRRHRFSAMSVGPAVAAVHRRTAEKVEPVSQLPEAIDI